MIWTFLPHIVVMSGTGGSSSAAAVKAEAYFEADGDGPPRKKGKKGLIIYEPCGRGEYCTCAICKKAKQQQVWTPAHDCVGSPSGFVTVEERKSGSVSLLSAAQRGSMHVQRQASRPQLVASSF